MPEVFQQGRAWPRKPAFSAGHSVVLVLFHSVCGALFFLTVCCALLQSSGLCYVLMARWRGLFGQSGTADEGEVGIRGGRRNPASRCTVMRFAQFSFWLGSAWEGEGDGDTGSGIKGAELYTTVLYQRWIQSSGCKVPRFFVMT